MRKGEVPFKIRVNGCLIKLLPGFQVSKKHTTTCNLKPITVSVSFTYQYQLLYQKTVYYKETKNKAPLKGLENFHTWLSNLPIPAFPVQS